MQTPRSRCRESESFNICRRAKRETQFKIHAASIFNGLHPTSVTLQINSRKRLQRNAPRGTIATFPKISSTRQNTLEDFARERLRGGELGFEACKIARLACARE